MEVDLWQFEYEKNLMHIARSDTRFYKHFIHELNLSDS